jgi:hypothetical protein
MPSWLTLSLFPGSLIFFRPISSELEPERHLVHDYYVWQGVNNRNLSYTELSWSDLLALFFATVPRPSQCLV